MNKQVKITNYKRLPGVASVALCSVALATGFLTHAGVNTGQTVLAGEQQTDNSVKNVNTAQDFQNALNNASITKINVTSDITFDNLNEQPLVNRSLEIDGQNHKIDFAHTRFNMGQPRGDNPIIHIHNLTAYGTDFYGPFYNNDNTGTISYDNFNYYGPQLINAPKSTVQIGENVNINIVQNYTNLNGQLTSIADANQENITAKNIVFLENSSYKGNTTSGSNLFDIQSGGKVTFMSNSNVEVTTAFNSQPIAAGTSNVEMQSGSSFTIKPLSQVNVSYPMTMTGAILNIQSPNNDTTATPLLSLSKTITMNNSSAMNVTGNTNQNGTLVNGLSAANLMFKDSNSTINVQTNKTDNNNPLATSLDDFKNNDYSWEMRKSSGDNLTTDFTKYDANQYKSLKISKSAKSIGIDDSSIQLSKNNDNKVNISYTPSLNNVAEQDTVKYDLSIKNGETDKTPSPKPEITDRTSSFNGLDYSTPAVGDVITVTSYLNNKESGKATKTLNQEDIANLTDSGTTTNPQPEPQPESNTVSLQSGLVNYVKDYGVLLWQLTANGLEPTTQYQPANSYVPYYFDYQIVDGIKYLHIANQNTWIQAQYLQDPTQLPEIPMNNTAVAGNVPYGIYLRDGSGNMTEQIIEPGTSWQVFAKKTFHGHTYYRLGNDQQWLEDTYIQSMN